MIQAVFLDRDGTIIKEKDYLSKIVDVELLDNAVEGLKILQDNGYVLFIISNQSGVARGYFSENTVVEINNYLKDMLLQKGVAIEQIYYCPHHKGGSVEEYSIDCDCRKPKTGMIRKAQSQYKIDMENSYVIGDKKSDIQLALNCNCRAVWVLTGYGKDEQEPILDSSVSIANDLLEAAEIIVGQEKRHSFDAENSKS